MTNVPTYGQRKQTLKPVFTGKLQNHATPEAFGAGIGRGMQNLAGGIRQAADALDVVKTMEDKAVVDEHVNQFSDYARERTYNPETGYMALQGGNAVEGREGFKDDLETQRKTIGEKLTPNQQRLYDEATQARRNQALDTSIRHASAQRKQWFDDASTARLNTFADDALAMSDEPEKLTLNMAAASREITERAAANGWSEDQTKVAQEEFRSGAHKNIVLKNAVENPLKAQEWLDGHRGEMTQAHQYELDKALAAPVLEANAQREADRIMTSGGAARPPRANAAGSIGTRVKRSNSTVDFDNVKPDTKTAFGKLQNALGYELTVRSGHRTPEANAAAGGAENSQHMHGNAIDIDVRGMSKKERLELIDAAFDAGFTGIGVGQNTIHVDQGKPRAWGYATAAGGAPVPAYAAATVQRRLAGAQSGQPAPQGFTVGATGAGFTEFVHADGRVERREGTRAWRNNNPGNIEYGKFAKAHGAVGTDGRFAVFPSYEAGRKAKAELLFNSSGYAGRTIKSAINRYAPPKENNTASYVATVAAAAGVPADTKMSDLTGAQREAVLDAMERVEGFSAGQANTAPGYTGPQWVIDQVAGIADPRLRAATAAAITKTYALQDAAERRASRQSKLEAEKFIIQNPGTDPTKLPLNTQLALGVDGMNTLWSLNDRVKDQGKVETDEVLFAELQRLQAEDPLGFADDVDMFDYMDKLSTKDRRDLQQLQLDAVKDRRDGKEKSLTEAKSVSTAMSIADDRLTAAGVKKTGKAATEESAQREARFQRALVDRMREFQQREERVPNDYEVSDMVDQLLLPVIMKTPGMLWDSEDEGFVFEAPFRADDATVAIDIPYEQIPADVRLAIREELAKELGRAPTEDEVKTDYVEFVLGTR